MKHREALTATTLFFFFFSYPELCKLLWDLHKCGFALPSKSSSSLQGILLLLTPAAWTAWWFRGLHFTFFFFLYMCYSEKFSFSPFSFPSTSPHPSPQLPKWTLCCGCEGEDEVSANAQPCWPPNICKSCLANQNCLSNHLTLNFPDKEMFMPFFSLSSSTPSVGVNKPKPHTGLWG